MLYMFIVVFLCGESIPVVGFSCKSMVLIIIANKGQLRAKVNIVGMLSRVF